MERSEEQLEALSNYRQKNHLVGCQNYVPKSEEESTDNPRNVHFFNYDPSVGQNDLSKVHIKKKKSNNSDTVVSIPLEFTHNNKTEYHDHTNSDFGYDIRLYMTKNRTPMYPLRK